MNNKTYSWVLVVILFSAAPAFAAECGIQSGKEGAENVASTAGAQSTRCDAESSITPAANGGDKDASFLSSVDWKMRFGLTNFQVEDSNTFGAMIGFKGEYETARGIRLRLLLTSIVDFDLDHLDPDHIPVWFKSYFKAEKKFFAPDDQFSLLATLDVEHKMNTVSSIEQSADLMPGIKFDFETPKVNLFAKFGAGGYYLEIDDDLPEIYSDYRREDLTSTKLAYFQEYKAGFWLTEQLSVSGRYKKFNSFDSMKLETRKHIKINYQLNPARHIVFKVERTTYNLDQFTRSAGDNGLSVLPFNKDTYYQAYYEYDF